MNLFRHFRIISRPKVGVGHLVKHLVEMQIHEFGDGFGSTLGLK